MSSQSSDPPHVSPQSGEDFEDDSPSQSVSGRPSRRSASGYTACIECKHVKARCEYDLGAPPARCHRCREKGYPCTPRHRKTRVKAPTQEELEEQSREQDRRIEALLQEHDRLALDESYKERFRHSPIDSERTTHVSLTESRRLNIRLAARAQFSPPLTSASVASLTTPEIVERGIIDLNDVQGLFDLFFQCINSQISVLDRSLHTPANLIWTSHLLFTTICVISLRYSRSPSSFFGLWDCLREVAQNTIANGSKTVENCQAFLLIALYQTEHKKWIENPDSLYLEVAIRMAEELNLTHLSLVTVVSELDQLNRGRTWMAITHAEALSALRVGGAASVQIRQETITNFLTRFAVPLDEETVCLLAEVDILRIALEITALVNTKRAENANLGELLDAVQQGDLRLVDSAQQWIIRLQRQFPWEAGFRRYSLFALVAYLRLVILALGVHESLVQDEDGGAIQVGASIMSSAVDAASAVINNVVDRLAPSSLLCYAPQSAFERSTFCALFLIQVTRSPLPVDVEDRVTNIQRLILALSSDTVRVHDQHAPYLYASFLSSVLETYLSELSQGALAGPSRVDVLHGQPDAGGLGPALAFDYFADIFASDQTGSGLEQGDIERDLAAWLASFDPNVPNV